MKILGEIDGIPVILISPENMETNSSFPGAMTLKFWCPYCHRWHMHGDGGNWDGTPTHRWAHCDVNKRRPFTERGYMLATDAGWRLAQGAGQV